MLFNNFLSAKEHLDVENGRSGCVEMALMILWLFVKLTLVLVYPTVMQVTALVLQLAKCKTLNTLFEKARTQVNRLWTQ
jgi:hypothetical protein